MFVADDGDNSTHFDQAEKLSGMIDTTIQNLNIHKVYIDAYPKQKSPSGGMSSGAKKAVSANLNTGMLIVNYTGHGVTQNFVTSNFNTTDIEKTSNFGKYPFAISVACNNGKFVNATCLAEKWLRATKDNKTTGAIGVCASSILMDWAPPMQTQDEIVRLLGSPDPSIRKITLGALFNNGQYSMLEKYGQDGEDVVQTWLFFGDPSTVFRNKITKPLNYKIDTCINYSNTIEFELSSSLDSISVGITKNNQFVDQGMFVNKKFTYSFPKTSLKENYLITLTKQNHTIEQFTINTDNKEDDNKEDDNKEDITSIQKTNNSTLKIHPNPANTSITIPNTTNYSLEIYTIEGKLVDTYLHPGGYNFSMDTNLLKSGNYLFKITSNNAVFTEKVQITH